MLLFLRNWLAVWQLFCGKQCVFHSLVSSWLSLYYRDSAVSGGVTKCGSLRPLKKSQLLQLHIPPHCQPSIFLYICQPMLLEFSFVFSFLLLTIFILLRSYWRFSFHIQHHCISLKVAVSVILTVYSTYWNTSFWLKFSFLFSVSLIVFYTRDWTRSLMCIRQQLCCCTASENFIYFLFFRQGPTVWCSLSLNLWSSFPQPQKSGL